MLEDNWIALCTNAVNCVTCFVVIPTLALLVATSVLTASKSVIAVFFLSIVVSSDEKSSFNKSPTPKEFKDRRS